MLMSVEIENFRCFARARFDLAPFTVLVGPNASGKSSVLDALNPDLVVTAADRNPSRDGNPNRVVWEGGGRSGSPGTVRYGYQRVALRVDACRADGQANPARRIDTDGGNLANVVFNLPREAQQAYSDRFCALVPAFSSVEPKGHGNGYIGLEFRDRWAPLRWYDAREVSDGTVLAAAYLVLAYQTVPPALLAVEEPEQGLHPTLIGHVIAALRSLVEQGIQVIVATHSPVVVDHADPSEVRFLRRDPKTGDVQVETAPSTDTGWGDYLRTFDDSLGAAWLSGGLGG